MITYNSIPELLDTIPPPTEIKPMEQLSFKFMEQLNKEHDNSLAKEKLLEELEYYIKKTKPEFVEGILNTPDNHIVKYYSKKQLEIEDLISRL